MSLSREEIARAKFTFSIYDFDGSNQIDAFQLGNALRALGLCPSLKKISNLGGTIQRGEKMLKVEEFLAIYQEAKGLKEESGTIEDYLECLSSHDKEKNGKISSTTLGHLLQGYGEERLDRLEVEEIIEDCGQPEDDGMVDYRDFIKRLMKGPEIKIPIAMLRATEEADDSGIEFSRRSSTDQAAAFPRRRSRPSQDLGNQSTSLKKTVSKQKECENAEGEENEKKQPVSLEKSTFKKDETGEIEGESRHQPASRRKSESKKFDEGESEGERINQSQSTSKTKTESKEHMNGKSESREEMSQAETKTPNRDSGKKTERKPEQGHESGSASQGQTDDQVEKGKEKLSKSSTKSSRRSVTSTGQGGVDEPRDGTISPDDMSATSDTYQADISKSRNSMKSVKSQGGGSDIDGDGTSIFEDDTSDQKPAGKSRGSGKSKKGSVADISTSDGSGGDANLSSARSTLKSKSEKSGESKQKAVKKKEKEPEVKAKFQQPLISLKTDGLFGKKK